MSSFDWKNVPAPWQIAALPQDQRGFPVPVVTPRNAGEFDFGGISAPRVVLCGAHRLCGVCGCPLDDDVWHLSDDEGLSVELLDQSLADGKPLMNLAPQGEPPLHYECALYAASVCPYLAHPTSRRTTATALDEKGNRRPERMLLKRVEGFELVESPHFGFAFQYGRLLEFEVVEAEAEAAERLTTFLTASPPRRSPQHSIWSAGDARILEEAKKQIGRLFPHLTLAQKPARPPARSAGARKSKRKAQGAARKVSRKTR